MKATQRVLDDTTVDVMPAPEVSGRAGVAGVQVMQVLLSLDPGGTERLAIELTRRLHRRHGMTICCLDRPGAWASEVEGLGVPVVALERSAGFVPRIGRQIATLARSRGVSVLHCHHYSPFVYGVLARLWSPVRVIYTEHGRAHDGPPSGKRRLVNTILACVPDGVYAVSKDLKQHMVREGFSADRIQVISNGVAAQARPDAAARVRARVRLGAHATDFLIGAVGRLDPVKDLPTLIAAFSRVRRQIGNGRLILVGDGPSRDSLTAIIEQEGLHDCVTLLGQRADVAALLPGFDVLVNSSIFEGVSLTILEAMAAGLPIVATRVGGTPEVIEDGVTGVLVPARQPHAIVEALLRLAIDPDRGRTLGAAARERFETQYSIEQMVNRYASIYNALEVS